MVVNLSGWILVECLTGWIRNKDKDKEYMRNVQYVIHYYLKTILKYLLQILHMCEIINV